MSPDNDPRDPWKDFPGGNPFGPGGPLGGGDPFRSMDEWLRQMGIDPAEFPRLAENMQRSLQDAFRNIGQEPGKSFVSGFSVRVGPDGKPQFSSFGNKPAEVGDGKLKVMPEGREPLTDVIEDPVSVSVTMELPGVDKRDINLHMTEEELEITVDTEARKYHKRVRLPAKVDPKTTKATYNNGILDVVVRKIERGTSGVRIDVE